MNPLQHTSCIDHPSKQTTEGNSLFTWQFYNDTFINTLLV